MTFHTSLRGRRRRHVVPHQLQINSIKPPPPIKATNIFSMLPLTRWLDVHPAWRLGPLRVVVDREDVYVFSDVFHVSLVEVG